MQNPLPQMQDTTGENAGATTVADSPAPAPSQPPFSLRHSHGCGCGHHHEPAVSQRVGRNEPCPCGSGKKHKKCCLK